MRRFARIVTRVFVMACGSAVTALGDEAITFNRDIRPIFSDTCFKCHGFDRNARQADLRLDIREDALAVRGDVTPIVPGDPGHSDVVRRITATNLDERMPPADSNRSLTPEQIELIRTWIAQGAEYQPHWSLVAPVSPAPPVVDDQRWVRNPIDRFVLARQAKAGMSPSPEAGKSTLIRRATLDLTGLPPTPSEVTAFLADDSPEAYERAVERLLASPRYGERMVLEWLDAGRYADSNGYQSDGTRTLWPWRDWAIRRLNENQPFDQFTVEQLAGDLLPNSTIDQRVATGFNRNHPLNGEGGRIAEESRNDYVMDRVETTSTVWLGLTLGCCRCHDHKYDPFTQRDYYRLFAYFNNVNETGAVDRGGNAAPVVQLITPEHETALAELRSGVAAAEGRLNAALEGIDAARAELAAERKKLADFEAGIPQSMVMEELPQPRESFILVRGIYDKHGERVEPGVPASLPPPAPDAPSNRLGLARWLVDRANPLTARVTVNRYWQMFFGTGLVRTPEDFGTQGEPPSHPELLDWLAVRFVESGWNVKAMHRLIVTSATYRQSSFAAPELLERDPANRLLARGPRHRLSAFALRDQALAVSGLLVDRLGGPPVRPYQPAGVWEDATLGKIRYEQDHGDNLYRRSLYTFWRRTVGPTMFFDVSPRNVCTVRLPRTNTPLQALILMNDLTYIEAARALAQRLLSETSLTPDERIARAFLLATARQPRSEEQIVLTRALDQFRRRYQADREAAQKLAGAGEAPRDANLDVAELAALTAVTSLILNLDEVMTKE